MPFRRRFHRFPDNASVMTNASTISNESVSSTEISSIEKDFTDPKTPHNRIIVVEEQKFYVYAGHLSFCSEFFRTMFEADFKEKDQEEVKIGEVNAADFHEFLQALIPGNSSTITVDNYLPIMACARRFLASEVLSMCEKFILLNFDNLDKIDLLRMAFEYDLDYLKDKIAACIIPNAQTGSNCIHGINQAFCQSCNNFGMFAPPQVVINQTSFLVINQDKLLDLPAEIHSFILKLLVEKVKHR